MVRFFMDQTLLHKKTVLGADFSEINKCEGSNKASSWENFLKKNKKNSMLIRDFRVCTIYSIPYFPTAT